MEDNYEGWPVLSNISSFMAASEQRKQLQIKIGTEEDRHQAEEIYSENSFYTNTFENSFFAHLSSVTTSASKIGSLEQG
jgi:hypothetical protein